MTHPSKEAQMRAERLAKALRANLGRRKSQARGRASAAVEPGPAAAAAESEAEVTGDTEMPQKETG
ncbi:hypothetical protein [Labrys monachus]|uniref:Type IV secretory pathway TrbL component n=1 Tax=Labrys monachus TaxID=217067 RepID=A0ABU0FDN2_9HYPH|nr:hypothetical protein [Labrys monachus]MDQ0392631.1 type IV secretory pathway TrbL component [Labrys monachus]